MSGGWAQEKPAPGWAHVPARGPAPAGHASAPCQLRSLSQQQQRHLPRGPQGDRAAAGVRGPAPHLLPDPPHAEGHAAAPPDRRECAAPGPARGSPPLPRDLLPRQSRVGFDSHGDVVPVSPAPSTEHSAGTSSHTLRTTLHCLDGSWGSFTWVRLVWRHPDPTESQSWAVATSYPAPLSQLSWAPGSGLCLRCQRMGQRGHVGCRLHPRACTVHVHMYPRMHT